MAPPENREVRLEEEVDKLSEPELRRVQQVWLSRQLHDDLGPSLCAAGLQLSLMRTEDGELPPECNVALDAVQGILDTIVDRVRLLSYAVCPSLAAQCGLRDMVSMLGKAFHVEVPEFEEAPPATGAAAIELAEQLLDCLLQLSLVNSHRGSRILILPESIVLDASGLVSDTLKPFAAKSLEFWRTELRERTGVSRTSLTWTIGATQES